MIQHVRFAKRLVLVTSTIICLSLACFSLACLSTAKTCFANPESVKVPTVSAQAAVVMDARSFDLLYEKNASLRLPMASTTKIMTALLALEKMDLNAGVTVPEEAQKVTGSRIYLEAGEQYSLSDMLYALMISSANDAAVAIAVNVAGSEEEFVSLMNQKARELYLDDTHFCNPHGLDATGHYTTARDLAALAAVAMSNSEFRRFASTVEATIPYPRKGSVRELKTHNYLLTGYPGATGVKTGFTNKAGYCVVGSAADSGREVIAVVLHSEAGKQWRDVSVILDYGLQRVASNPNPEIPQDIPPNDAGEAQGDGSVSYSVGSSVKREQSTRFGHFFDTVRSRLPLSLAFAVCGTLVILKSLSALRGGKARRRRRALKFRTKYGRK